jgi:hypothetical protein
LNAGRAARFCLVAAAVAAAGCGEEARLQQFKPDAEAARKALETALSEWKGGRKEPGRIEGVTPPLQVVDTVWGSGKKLASFEIGEAADFEVSKKFKAKLTLEGAAGPEEVTYLIVGKDPLWIFREQDYPGSTM